MECFNSENSSISTIFGVPCKLKWDYFSYLRMSVSIGNAREDSWELTLDKMKRKVQKWGTSWLNLAGRLALLKSGLSSLPLYQFSLAQAPTSFLQKMDNVFRFFLWQGGKNERKKSTWLDGNNSSKTKRKEALALDPQLS